MSTTRREAGLADGLIDSVSKLKLSDDVEQHAAPDAQQKRRRRVRAGNVPPGLSIDKRTDNSHKSETVQGALSSLDAKAADSVPEWRRQPASGDAPRPRTAKQSLNVRGPRFSDSRNAQYVLPSRERFSKPGVKSLDSPIIYNDIKNPYRLMLPRPAPTEAYLTQAEQAPKSTGSKDQTLLVVLDLNGTLIHRKKARGATSFVARPLVAKFLNYLFINHDVMIWSSARETNVLGIAHQLLTTDQISKTVAIWAREHLRLSPEAYNEKVQVYKQLSWIWENKAIQALRESTKTPYSQANTVLIDDSVEKAASEPYNLLRIDEFEARKDQMESNTLDHVMGYLNQLARCDDVSAYMRANPFNTDNASQWTGMKRADQQKQPTTSSTSTASKAAGRSRSPKTVDDPKKSTVTTFEPNVRNKGSKPLNTANDPAKPAAADGARKHAATRKPKKSNGTSTSGGPAKARSPERPPGHQS